MRKKFILIPVGAGLVLFLLFSMFSKEETGNSFKMTYPVVEAETDTTVDSVVIYFDHSGSMKGFVDFAGLPSGKSSIVGVLGNMMDNFFDKYHAEVVCFCGEKSYTRQQFLNGMENASIFNGQTTELHKMIREISEKTDEKMISVIATDMVLSYGKPELINQKDTFYNRHQLDNLGAQIHNAMTSCKKKGLDVLVLQYVSSYNGLYYCNFTENLKPNLYRGEIMKDRPFYLMVLGNKNKLKSLMAKHCFNKPRHIYASFPMDSSVAEQDYNVAIKDGSVSWLVGDVSNMEQPGSISTTADFGDAMSQIELTCKRFEIPGYVSTDVNGQLTVTWDESCIDSVRELTDSPNEMKLVVTLKPYNQLATTEGVWVRLNSDVSWVNNSSTDDDTKGDSLEGKTWGLNTVISNINKAFRGESESEPEKVAEFKFNIIKN